MQQALAIRNKALGPEHPDVARSLNSLAELYMEQGKYGEAEPLCNQALAIDTKVLGPEHPDVAFTLNSLAVLYQEEGKYAEAERLYNQALAIDTKVLGPEHPLVAATLSNLAALYEGEGKYPDAEPLYNQALAISRKALGAGHPDVAATLNNFGELYYGWQRPQEAEFYFDSSFQVFHTVIEKQFAYMSEKERLSFLGSVQYAFPLYSSFVYSYRDRNPSSVGRLYDLLLWEKGMVAESISALRAKVAAKGDKEALALLDRIAQKKTQIARLTASPPNDVKLWERARQDTMQLAQEANDLERELVKHSPTIAQQRAETQSTWQDVRAKLKPGDAAVEFVRYGFHDGKHWTGKSYYAALAITPETKVAPAFVPLGDAAALECGPLNNYRRLVNIADTCSPCRNQPGQAHLLLSIRRFGSRSNRRSKALDAFMFRPMAC